MPQLTPPLGLGPLGLLLPPQPPRERAAAAWHTGGATDDATFGSTPWVLETCREAEEAGASAIWASDHLFWRRPTLECLTTLAVAAVATRRSVLGTCVLQLPLRRAAAVAKQVSSLQLLSGQRVVLGVGVGSHEGEYRAAGAPFATRGRALDEGITELRRIWGNDGAAPAYRHEPALAAPVWVGGSSPAALRRAARLGDGWVPLFVGPERFRADLATVREQAARAGRDPEHVTPAVVMVAAVGRAPDAAAAGLAGLSDLYGFPPRAFERHLVAGSATHCAAAAERYLDAGASHVAVMVAGDGVVGAFGQITEALGAAVPAEPALAGAGS